MPMTLRQAANWLKTIAAAAMRLARRADSPLAKAPPFREVVTRYPPESLGEALVEGIVTGHNEMPEFVFEADQATEIIAYLDSLKAK